MSDKDQCQAAFLATNSEYCRTDERWMGWQQAWAHLSAELAANREENAQFNKAFLEVCDERDHWHSWSLIRETNEIALRKELAASREREARLRKALQAMVDMPRGYSMGREYSDECERKEAYELARAALSQSIAPASEAAVLESCLAGDLIEMWTSTKTSLPGINTLVLVYSADTGLHIAYRGERCPADFFDKAAEHFLDNVTHWMPLPPAPTENN